MSDKGQRDGGKVGGMIALAYMVSNIVEPIIEPLIDFIKIQREGKVNIPKVCVKDFPLTLEQATTLLKNDGFKVETIAVGKAAIKYKDYFDSQVIGVNIKQKEKVKQGTTVFLKYVTAEIIEESQRLFEEAEKNKAEVKLEKTNKRLKKKEKNKRFIKTVAGNIGRGTSSTAVKAKTKIKRVIAHKGKKSKNQEVYEKIDS